MKTLTALLALALSCGSALAQEYHGATGMVPLQSIRGATNVCILFDVVTSSGTVTFAVDPKTDGWKVPLIIARTQAGLPITVVTADDYSPPLQPWIYPPTIPCPSGVSSSGVVGSAEITFAAGIR